MSLPSISYLCNYDLSLGSSLCMRQANYGMTFSCMS
jgi:hypothetical protein